jgi:hypothetical protein
MRFRMEAAGIEPVSDDRTETQKGNWTYQALMRAKRIREQSRTGPTDDDPRSQRGPSGSTATPSGGAAMSRRAQRKAEARRRALRPDRQPLHLRNWRRCDDCGRPLGLGPIRCQRRTCPSYAETWARERLAKRRRLHPMVSLIAKVRKWLGIGQKR